MNITHLKYAVEVERTGSITRAAENLYMSQPNLSKAIRELETALGIRLFKRSSTGVAPTEQGAQFLARAREVLMQIAEMEALYSPAPVATAFRAAGPRAGYVSYAFARFAAEYTDEAPLDLAFSETDAPEIMQGVSEGEFDMGVLRFACEREGWYLRQLAERNLKSELLWEFDMRVLMGCGNPLAQEALLTADMLSGGIEIASPEQGPRGGYASRRVFARERAGRVDILLGVKDAFMLASPTPGNMLSRLGLVERRLADAPRARDMLIFPGVNAPGGYERRFSDILKRVRDNLEQS